MTKINTEQDFAKINQRRQLQALHGATLQLMSAVKKLNEEVAEHLVKLDKLQYDVGILKDKVK